MRLATLGLSSADPVPAPSMITARTTSLSPPSLRALKVHTTRTNCPYCAFQCGMQVQTVSGLSQAGAANSEGESPLPPALSRPEVRPDPDFPVNRGQMCIKGFTSADLLDHPARVTSPMLRSSAGRLVPASW